MTTYTELPISAVVINHDSLRKPIRSIDREMGPTPYYGASGVIDHISGFTHDGHYLLVAEDGENLRSRSTPIAFTTTGKIWVNNHAHVLTGNARARTKYLAYTLENLDISGYLTGSTQPKLTRAALDSIRVRIPLISVQDAVVDVISSIDEKILANNCLGERIEDLLGTEFKLIVAKATTNSSPVVSLPFYFDLNPRCPAPTDDTPVYLSMQKLPSESMLVSDWETRDAKSGVRFRNGDTLLARITPCLENRKTGYVDFLEPDQTGIGSTEYIVLRSREGVPKSLSYFLAITDRFREFAMRHMIGSSGRQRLSAADLSKFTLPEILPENLHAWGEMAEPLIQRLSVARDETRTLQALRRTLLPNLLAGKLSVQDAKSKLVV